MADELKVISHTYDLILYAVPIVQRFPNKHRFSLGVRIENLLYDILEDLVDAKYSKAKRDRLLAVNLKLEKARFLVRLTCDFRVLSVGAYEDVVKRLDAIGRLVGGWIKKASK